MSKGQQPKRYSFPWLVSFGSPPAPVERNHRLIQLAARYVGGDTERWGAQEWELASRYLARALEIATIRSLQLCESFDLVCKRPRGRPRKGIPLCVPLRFGDLKTKRKRGRPLIWTRDDWVDLHETVNTCRQALTRKNPGKRITDKLAITHLVRLVSEEEGKSEAWVRRTVSEMQKLYSESKKHVGKIREKS